MHSSHAGAIATAVARTDGINRAETFQHGDAPDSPDHYGIDHDPSTIDHEGVIAALRDANERSGDWDFRIDVCDEPEYATMYDYDLVLAVNHTLS